MKKHLLLINAILILFITSCKKSNTANGNTNSDSSSIYNDVSFFSADTNKVYKNGNAIFTLPATSGGIYDIYVNDSKDVFILCGNGDFYNNNNKLATYSMPTSSFTRRVFYVNDNNVYIGGGESYTHPIYGAHYRPLIYKNGVKQIMQNAPGITVIGQPTIQYVSSIYVLNGDIYASGLSHLNAISGVIIPPSFMLWKNGAWVTYSNALSLDDLKPYVIPKGSNTPKMLYVEKTGSIYYLLHMLNSSQGYPMIFDPRGQITYNIDYNSGGSDIVYARLLTGSDYKADILSTKSGNKLGSRSFEVVRSIKVFLSVNNDEYVIANVREINGVDKIIMLKNGVDYAPPINVNSIRFIK